MLWTINGDVGTGKTLLATIMALEDSRDIYSNYEIKSDRWHELTPEVLNEAKKALVIIDEAYTWIESRMPGKKLSVFSTHILFQSRKKEMDIVVTEQLVRTIDVRFRLMTTFEVHCDVTEEGFEYRIFYRNRPPVKMLLPFEVAERVYPYYDTYEEISAIDKDMLIEVSSSSKKTMVDIDHHVKLLLKKNPPEKYTQRIISHYVIRNDLPKKYADLIYNAIKAAEILGE